MGAAKFGSPLMIVVGFMFAGSGCASILGFDDEYTEAPGGVGAGGTAGSSEDSSVSASSGDASVERTGRDGSIDTKIDGRDSAGSDAFLEADHPLPPCADGRARCESECFDLAGDPRHCGSCDHQCDVGQVCRFRMCEDLLDCRKQPCSGFTYCDLSNGKCLAGCLQDNQCANNETCDRTTHTCPCRDGYHRFESGQCGLGCEIYGTHYDDGNKNPDNECEVCDSSTAISAWTKVSDSTACGSGQYCNRGQCVDCLVGRECQPQNPCHKGTQACDTAMASCVDTGLPVTEGATCGNSMICHQGSCTSGCYVSGSFYASGATKSGNGCYVCQPTQSASQLTLLSDGSSCATGKVCQGGSCDQVCWINSEFYAANTVNSNDPCQSCQPNKDTAAWSPLPAGTQCNNAGVCSAGACKTGCWIDEAFVEYDTVSPSDPCKACLPSDSRTEWSVDDGRQCASRSVCYNGSCRVGCLVYGELWYEGDASSTCNVCDPSRSVMGLSPANEGDSCYFGTSCNGSCEDGACCALGCGCH